jgi:hypothetical protein
MSMIIALLSAAGLIVSLTDLEIQNRENFYCALFFTQLVAIIVRTFL